MKEVLILSSDKNWKAELALILARYAKESPLKWTYVSNRTDVISELSLHFFDAIVIHSHLPLSHLQIIFKYLSSTDYKDTPLFFISDQFENFQALINSQNFSKLTMLAAPIEAEQVAKSIVTTIYPVNTTGPADGQVKINLEFVKVFVDSTKYILESFCLFKNVSHGKPTLYNSANAPKLALEGRIELTSNFFEGQFIIGFIKESYLEILKLALGQEDKDIGPENEDFAGEIVNMVYGQAKTVLNSTGHDFKKVIPTFVRSPGVHSSQNPIVIVPLSTDAGTIHLLFEVRKLK